MIGWSGRSWPCRIRLPASTRSRSRPGCGAYYPRSRGSPAWSL